MRIKVKIEHIELEYQYDKEFTNLDTIKKELRNICEEAAKLYNNSIVQYSGEKLNIEPEQ